MPSVVPNPKAIRPLVSEAAFEAWLSKGHDRESEVRIKLVETVRKLSGSQATPARSRETAKTPTKPAKTPTQAAKAAKATTMAKSTAKPKARVKVSG